MNIFAFANKWYQHHVLGPHGLIVVGNFIHFQWTYLILCGKFSIIVWFWFCNMIQLQNFNHYIISDLNVKVSLLYGIFPFLLLLVSLFQVQGSLEANTLNCGKRERIRGEGETSMNVMNNHQLLMSVDLQCFSNCLLGGSSVLHP